MEEEKHIPAQEAPVAEAATQRVSKKVKKRHVSAGQVHVKSTFNNTIVVVTDKTGAVLTSSSAGANGFRGSKKGTAYAAGVAAEKAIEKAKTAHGLSSAEVYIHGIGLGRDAAIRALSSFSISIESITDKTALPHGGVRPKGERNM
ncbi:30S ribosomal protein S11 [Candidatus Saccharibacteria bacterium]|nr:30S ribosomal protein S11 [Candidatus Saccharibacteria bacterium]